MSPWDERYALQGWAFGTDPRRNLDPGNLHSPLSFEIKVETDDLRTHCRANAGPTPLSPDTGACWAP